MSRFTNRAQRRSEILVAFAQVFADRGYAGATIAAVAAKADMSPGLLHHHFHNKREMLDALFEDMIACFRSRVQGFQSPQGLSAQSERAYEPKSPQDHTLARCFVGLFAEALRDPQLFDQARGLLERERLAILADSHDEISDEEAHAILAYLIGALTLEAFAPPVPPQTPPPSTQPIQPGGA